MSSRQSVYSADDEGDGMKLCDSECAEGFEAGMVTNLLLESRNRPLPNPMAGSFL